MKNPIGMKSYVVYPIHSIEYKVYDASAKAVIYPNKGDHNVF